MSDATGAWESPTIEVRVFRHGDLIDRVLCETEEEAVVVVERWSDLDDVSCLVDDLSYQHTPGDVLEPEPSEALEDDYPPGPAVEPGERDGG